jgi:putative endonuclease
LTNEYNNVLYIGVTNNLQRRIHEHKSGEIKGFTQKYNCTKLVYFESFNQVEAAIAREKQLKNWKREWKNALVEVENPEWRDLATDWEV